MPTPLELVASWQKLIGPTFFGPKPHSQEEKLRKLSAVQHFKNSTQELAVLCEEHGIDSSPLAEAVFVEFDLSSGTYSGITDELGDKCCATAKRLEIKLKAGLSTSENAANGQELAAPSYLGISLDPGQMQAVAESGATASFEYKKPWQLFCALLEAGSVGLSRSDLMSVIWNKAVAENNLDQVKTKTNEIIAPLRLEIGSDNSGTWVLAGMPSPNP